MPGCEFSRRISWGYVGRYDHTLYNVFPDAQLVGVKDKKPTFHRLRREAPTGASRFNPNTILLFLSMRIGVILAKHGICPNAQTLLDTVGYVEVVQEMPCAWSPPKYGEKRAAPDPRAGAGGKLNRRS